MNWDFKPYYSLDFFLKKKFGVKVAKISVDAGFTCPNRDGSLSFSGCSFCSGRGSGDFALYKGESVISQLEKGKQNMKKWKAGGFVAYFQAYTNTYAPPDVLRDIYFQALEMEDLKGVAIATRPDCIDEDVISVLKELAQKTYVWVELGFQTSNENTARAINRGYKNEVFSKAVETLTENGFDTVAHVIFGLPGETEEDMMNTIDFLNKTKIKGIKIQSLHILKNTPLAREFEETGFRILEKEEYINLVCKALERLSPDIVVHRLTGDGKKSDVIAPKWAFDKKSVLNGVYKTLTAKNSWQGREFVL